MGLQLTDAEKAQVNEIYAKHHGNDAGSKPTSFYIGDPLEQIPGVKEERFFFVKCSRFSI